MPTGYLFSLGWPTPEPVQTNRVGSSFVFGLIGVRGSWWNWSPLFKCKTIGYGNASDILNWWHIVLLSLGFLYQMSHDNAPCGIYTLSGSVGRLSLSARLQSRSLGYPGCHIVCYLEDNITPDWNPKLVTRHFKPYILTAESLVLHPLTHADYDNLSISFLSLFLVPTSKDMVIWSCLVLPTCQCRVTHWPIEGVDVTTMHGWVSGWNSSLRTGI